MKKLPIFLLIIIFLLCSCAEKRITKQTFSFDTVINITADKSDEKKISEALTKCQKFEKIFSRTNPESELYKVNCGAKELKNEHLSHVINFGIEMSRLTDGAFDITIAPLSDVWNIKERTAPPGKSEIEQALKNVGYEKISFSPFNLNNTKIDLGALAKGYIADRLREEFVKSGCENAIIDLGGNIALIGEYTVGIRDPESPEKIFATIKLKDKSAVTSGSYQRYFEYNGNRYHHIIDPRTGYPTSNSIASVTVISPLSMHADALSTAIFVMGEAGLKLLKSFPDTDALILFENGEILTSDGFKEKYDLKLKNN
ncbi:MAG: FAD:protein FMN transferase [Clostridia bacterium]|nr:FAD:protein FMN transferase [Clostridia bacterium]